MKLLSKKSFFRLHSWIGVNLSILFFIVCFSGSLAVLSHEYDWLFFPEIRAFDDGNRASYNQMVSNIKEKYPDGKLTSIRKSEAPYLCNTANVTIEKQRYFVFVNPYSGAVQGETTITFYRFFRFLHYFLYIPNQIGHFIVLVFGFMLFISTVTALYFYKKWWKKLFELKIGKGKLVFFRSLHRLIGLWSVPFAILFSVTGIWYFLERTNTASISDIANTRSPKVAGISAKKDINVFDLDFDKAVAIAEKTIPNLEVRSISAPTNNKKTWYITGKSNVPLVRNRANRVYLDSENYTVLKVQDASKISTVTWINDIADPIHFGNWGGLIVKIIYFLGGLAISALILTGIWIFLKRNAKKRKQKINRVLLAINWVITLVTLFFIYGALYKFYNAPLKVFIILSCFVIILIYLGWYLFVKKINKA